MDNGVLDRIPSEWQMFLRYLESDMIKAEIVYNDMMFSQYGGRPQWLSLLKALLDEEPCIEDKSLKFKPRLLKLSDKLQEQFFMFLATHSNRIQDCDLRDFMKGIIKKCEITALNMHGSFQQFTELMKSRVMDPDMLEAFENFCKKQISKDSIDKDELGLDPYIIEDDSDDNLKNVEEFEQPAKKPRLEDNRALSKQTIDLDKHFDNSVLSKDHDKSENNKKEGSTPALGTLDQPDLCKYKLEDADAVATKESIDLVKRLTEDLVSDRNDLLEKDLQELTSLAVKDIEFVCRSVDFSVVTDKVVHSICELLTVMWREFSSGAICILLETILLSRIEALTQNASRQLILAVTLTAAKFPKPFIDAVMVPGLTSQHQFTRYKSDIYITVTKESLSRVTRLYFIEKLITSSVNFTDNNLTVIQCMVDSECEFNADVFHKFLQLLYEARFDFVTNLKFGKLLLSIVSKHGQVMRDRDLMEKIVDSHNTFLKKTILMTLKKHSSR